MTSRRTRIQLLGQFALANDVGEVDLNSKKLRALLAYLALENGAQTTRERLMNLLWGSHFETQARQNLRQALSRLRKLVGDALVVSGDERVGIDFELLETDVAKFEALCADGSREALERADDLYAGELLDGLALSEAAWEDWVSVQRSRLRDLAIEARANLADRLLQTSEYQAALAVARRGTALDPFREDVHRSVMQALAGLGRRAEALRTFDQLETLLQQELGTVPDAETVRVRDAIRDVPREFEKPASSDDEPRASDEERDGAPIVSPSDAHLSSNNSSSELPEPLMGDMDELVSTPSHPDLSPRQLLRAPLALAVRRPLLSWIVIGTVCFALIAIIVSPFYFSQESVPAFIGQRQTLVKSDQHSSALAGKRIDIRGSGDSFDQVSIWIDKDGSLRLEALRFMALRQRLQKDKGNWRSHKNQFCMTFGWYLGGTEFCAWIIRDGVGYAAVYPKNERTLNWVIRDTDASVAKRLVPEASSAGQLISADQIAAVMTDSELILGGRGPVRMMLSRGGQLDIELLRSGGPKGLHYETDHGSWSVEDDKLCLKPGWFDDGRKRCFSVRAGAFAYLLLDKLGKPTSILVLK